MWFCVGIMRMDRQRLFSPQIQCPLGGLFFGDDVLYKDIHESILNLLNVGFSIVHLCVNVYVTVGDGGLYTLHLEVDAHCVPLVVRLTSLVLVHLRMHQYKLNAGKNAGSKAT